MFVIHLNGQNLKTLLFQIQVIKMISSRKFGVCIFLLYLLANYEPIKNDLTAKTVTLGANLLVNAQTIPQNIKRALYFFKPQVAFA